MKVITEERLKEKLKEQIDKLAFKNNQFMSDSPYVENIKAVIFNELINELQELDTLTVTRLRPMIEAPITDEGMKKVKTILAWHIFEQMFIPIWVFSDGGAMTEGESFNIKEFEGWIPMPRYEPEKV